MGYKNTRSFLSARWPVKPLIPGRHRGVRFRAGRPIIFSVALTALLCLASLTSLARAQEAVPGAASAPCGPQADPSGLLLALEAIGDPAAQDAAEAIRMLLARTKLACQYEAQREAEIGALRAALAARGRLLEIARETTASYEEHFAEVDRLLPKLTGRRWGCTAGAGAGVNVLAASDEDSGAVIVGVLCGLHFP